DLDALARRDALVLEELERAAPRTEPRDAGELVRYAVHGCLRYGLDHASAHREPAEDRRLGELAAGRLHRHVAVLGAQGRADAAGYANSAHVAYGVADDLVALDGGVALGGAQPHLVPGQVRTAQDELVEGRQLGFPRDDHPAVEERQAPQAGG